MKKTTAFITAITVALCLLASCSTQPEPEPGPPPEEPTPAATPEPTPEPVIYQTVNLVNSSAYDMKEIWISSKAFDGEYEIVLTDPDDPGTWALETDRLRTNIRTDGELYPALPPAIEITFPSGGDYEYEVRLLDEDDDEFTFSAISLADCAEAVFTWNGNCYLAGLYDGTGNMYASFESEAGEENREAGARPDAKFDSEEILNEIDLLVHYPSKVFYLLDADNGFVELKSKDGKALIEVQVNEPWTGPEKGAMNTGIRIYEGIAKEIINEKAEGADDIKWYETDVVRTDYEGISNLLYIYSKADYTLDGQPMHTISMVNRWYRISDFAPYLFSVTLTATADMLDFYMDNYYYKISDSLTDRARN